MPQHPKARELARSGLFAGLSSFADLEARIAAIPENKGKGDAFEVFAEAYLATQRNHEVAEAWPLDAVPVDLLKKLKLPLKDYGVDGVTRTMLGGHQVYQVKFRSGRPSLTWEELSTFMGLSDSPEIGAKIVITNCDELPAVINERHNFFCIRGSDLDRMEASDFAVIESWLAEAVVRAPKKTPLPHQQEALDAILPALRTEPRATAIMACGTGKTLVTLWTAEQMGARKILVLLPSLALLRQTLHEWLRETSLDQLAYLCVCSDPTVKGDADEISTAQSDLDFEVSTKAETVRRFLDAPFDGTRIVFSTYQSASVVGEALKPGESFDLGIFDEAHKTAGREGRNYGYALEDRNIPIGKRLFVTATPRHYNPAKQTKEGEAALAFSMDDPKVYGPQSYVLSFSRAANLGIICGYKVIISVITSDQVNDELLSKGLVRVEGDEVVARQVANQIALRDAVAQYGVGKVFTFHSTVKSAASFVATGNEGVKTHLPEFETYHVSGAMPTAHRERLLTDFKRSHRAVMSNARCLTEGVDVPAVDMVAFLSPKKSKVDIVQAIGRAMRKSKGKETGYVLIPLYLEQKAGESLEEAVARTNFEEVWDILQSLKEQDDVLADLIRDMAEAKGRGKGYDDSRLIDRIEFTGPILALDSIRQSITTRVLERLESSWDVNFGKLVKFKEENGHCRFSRPKGYSAFGNWISTQRQAYTNRTLLPHRLEKLQSLGFEWDPRESDWENYFSALKSFKDKHGNLDIPYTINKYKTLISWVRNQRSLYTEGKQPIEKINRLNSIGFVWDPRQADWEANVRDLIIFKRKYGHCRVLRSYKERPKLANWISTLRVLYTKGLLPSDRIEILNNLGIIWYPHSEIWENQFESLKLFKKEFGHCRVPKRFQADRKLSTWVESQRYAYHKENLSAERIERLESLGFEWEIRKVGWDDYFLKLKDFKTKYGHCRIPQSFKEDPVFGRWVQKQRAIYSKGKLLPSRIAKLESLCFEWKLR